MLAASPPVVWWKAEDRSLEFYVFSRFAVLEHNEWILQSGGAGEKAIYREFRGERVLLVLAQAARAPFKTCVQ